MKLSISQPALTDALSWALNGVSARPPAPALSGVRIEAAQGVARFTGFDYETMAATTATVDTDTPGVIVAPGRATLDVVKGLPKKSTVTLEVTEGGKLRITAARSRYEIPLIPSDQYPQVPELPAEVGTVDGAAFGDAVKRVAVAASKDDSLPILTSLHITADGAGLSLESTDRYRVHAQGIPAELTTADASWLVRADRLAGRIPANGDVTILSDKSMFGIRTGTRAYITQVTDGEYPKISKLWPEDAPIRVTFDRDHMVQAVTAISSVVERNTPVVLNISDTEVVLEGGSADGGQGTEVVPGEANQPIRVAYNPVYLRESLGAMEAGAVTLALVAAPKPGVITCTGTQKALLMPVRLPETR